MSIGGLIMKITKTNTLSLELLEKISNKKKKLNTYDEFHDKEEFLSKDEKLQSELEKILIKQKQQNNKSKAN